jgi:AcrR family transcriptional regulator
MVKITDITRQALLDHATDAFAENGFDRASVRDITGRATVNQAAINYHFGGKEALYREILRLAVAAFSHPRRGGESLHPPAGDATRQTQPDYPLSAHFRLGGAGADAGLPRFHLQRETTDPGPGRKDRSPLPASHRR